MLCNNLKLPVNLLHLEDIGVDSFKYTEKMKGHFYHLKWDEYLYRQKKIEFLQYCLSQANHQIKNTNNLFRGFYNGDYDSDDLGEVLSILDEDEMSCYNNLKPSRRRSVSKLILSNESYNHFTIERVPCDSFEQKEALISYDHNTDWRLTKRSFEESSEDLVDEALIEMIINTTKLISNYTDVPKKISVFTHHTQIVCYPDSIATNSPEGIHQDGMDYIISALVIERKNILGGRSVIYGADKTTPIFQTNLQPGFGILQPNKNTDLWHTVRPVQSLDGRTPGYRSTIGFDFLF